MIAILKRYAVAFAILFAVFGLMIIATVGVKSLSDKMVADANITDKIIPRGEKLLK